MSPTTLNIIEKTIHNKLGSRISVSKCCKYFETIEKDRSISPIAFMNHFSIELAETIEFFVELERQGVMKSTYEFYCEKCHAFWGRAEVFNKISIRFVCKSCHTENAGVENARMVFWLSAQTKV